MKGHFELWPDIEGSMGFFRGVIRGYSITKTERRVIKDYKQFRRILGKQRR